MRKFIWVAFALSFLAVSSQAQQIPAADVSAGYSYFRVGGTGGANLNGFSTSAAYNANDWFGVVGDLGVVSRIAEWSGHNRLDVHGRSALFHPQVGQSCAFRGSALRRFAPFGVVRGR